MLDVVKALDPETLDEIAKGHCQAANEQFLAFRHLIDKSLVKGWWQKHAARHLRDFYNDLVAGKRPKLVMMAPPQHGKSRLVGSIVSLNFSAAKSVCDGDSLRRSKRRERREE